MGIVDVFKRNTEKALQEALTKLKTEEQKHQTILSNYKQELQLKENDLNDALIKIDLQAAEILDAEIKDLKIAISKEEELLNLLQPNNSIAVKTAVENIFNDFHLEVAAAKIKGEKEKRKIEAKIKELLDLMSNCDDINIQFQQRGNALREYLKYLNPKDTDELLKLYYVGTSVKEEPYPRYRNKLYFERLKDEIKKS